jgi:hypothetical protein
MRELHTHCQCDFCTGEDCELIKIDPDKIRKDERDRVLDILEGAINFDLKPLRKLPTKNTKELVYDGVLRAIAGLRQDGK